MTYDPWQPPTEEREPGCACDTCEGDNPECPNHGRNEDEPEDA